MVETRPSRPHSIPKNSIPNAKLAAPCRESTLKPRTPRLGFRERVSMIAAEGSCDPGHTVKIKAAAHNWAAAREAFGFCELLLVARGRSRSRRFLGWRLRSWFGSRLLTRRRSSWADQAGRVRGVERIQLRGRFCLFLSVQGNVHAPVLSQSDDLKVLQDPGLLFRGYLRVRLGHLLNFSRSELMFLAQALSLDLVGRNALLHQEVLRAFDATVGERLVVLRSTAGIGMSQQ